VPSDQAGNGQLDHYLAMLNFRVKDGHRITGALNGDHSQR
jgi:hypothetical protein